MHRNDYDVADRIISSRFILKKRGKTVQHRNTKASPFGRGLGGFGASPVYYLTVIVRATVWVTAGVPPVAVTVTVEVFAELPPQAVS